MAYGNKWSLIFDTAIDEQSLEDSISAVKKRAEKGASDKFTIKFKSGIDPTVLKEFQKQVSLIGDEFKKTIDIQGIVGNISKWEEEIDSLDKKYKLIAEKVDYIKRSSALTISPQITQGLDKGISDLEASLLSYDKADDENKAEILSGINKQFNAMEVNIQRVNNELKLNKQAEDQIREEADNLNKIYDDRSRLLQNIRNEQARKKGTLGDQEEFGKIAVEVEKIDHTASGASKKIKELSDRFNEAKANAQGTANETSEIVKVYTQIASAKHSMDEAEMFGDTKALQAYRREYERLLEYARKFGEEGTLAIDSQYIQDLKSGEKDLKKYKNALNELYKSQVKLQQLEKQRKSNPLVNLTDINEAIRTQREEVANNRENAEILGKLARQYAGASTQARAYSEYLTKLNAATAESNIQNRKSMPLWQNIANGMKDATARIVNYTVAYRGIQLVFEKFQQSIEIAKSLDETATNLTIASGKSREEVNLLMMDYNKMAGELGATTQQVAEAANDFLRMGLNAEEANAMIKASTVLSKLGMIDASEATEYLTSATKGYKVEAENAMSVVDKLTKVDMSAAVSAGYLAEAMSRSASGADLAGISMDKLLGYIASIGEVTQRSASTVGNSIKTMVARFTNVKAGVFTSDEADMENLNDIEKVLGKVGIKVRENETTFRDLSDVLDDIHEKWGSLNDVERNAVATAVASKTQYENFIVLMENYGKAQEYATEAENSAGTALSKYENYMESIGAKLNQITTQFEKFILTLGESDAIKGVLEAIIVLLENLTTDFSMGLIQIGLYSAGVVGVIGAITKLRQAFISVKTAQALFTKGMGQAAVAQGTYVEGTLLAKVATEGLTATLMKSPLVWAVAIGALIGVVNELINATDEVGKLEDKILETEHKISELNSQKQALESKEELNDLEKQRLNLLNQQLEILEAQRKEDERTLAGKKLEKQIAFNKYDENGEKVGQYIKHNGVVFDATGEDQERLLKQAREAYNKGDLELYDELIKKYRETQAAMSDYYNELVTYKDMGGDLSDDQREQIQILERLGKLYNENADIVQSAAEKNSYTAQSYNSLAEAINNITSAAETVADAYNEMNSNGELSLETVLKLLEADASYIDILEVQDGAIRISTDALREKVETIRQAEIMQREERIMALQTAEEALVNAGKNLTLAESFDAIAASANNAKNAMAGMSGQAIAQLTGLSDTARLEDVKKSIEQTRKEIDILKSSTFDTSKVFDKLGSSASKAASEASKAANEMKKAYKEAQDSIEDLIDMVVKMLKKEAELQKKALQEQIDKYKELIDVRKKAIESEDSQRKYQKDLDEKQKNVADIEAQIAALQYDTSREGVNKRKQLEEELLKAKDELNETQLEHEKDLKEDALDAEYERYKNNLDQQIKALEDYLSKEGEIRAQAIDLINQKSSELYQRLINWNRAYGDGVDQTIVDAWNKAYDALEHYGGGIIDVIGTLQSLINKQNELNAAIAAGTGGSFGGGGGSSSGGSTQGKTKVGAPYERFTGIMGDGSGRKWRNYVTMQRWSDGSETFVSSRQEPIGSAGGGGSGADSAFGYATGGTNSKPGLYALHGTQSAAETIFNASDSKKLWKFVNTLPEYKKNTTTNDGFGNIGNLLNVVIESGGVLDKSTLPQLERIAKMFNQTLTNRGLSRNAKNFSI